MNNFNNSLYCIISTELLDLISKTYSSNAVDFADVYNSLSLTPSNKLGHITLNCFSLSKKLDIKPNELGSTLCKKTNALAEFNIEQVGPYVNFLISPKLLFSEIIYSVNDESFFYRQYNSVKNKIMVEYSQPNTHKELHVGHMRNLCLGSAIVNIKKYCGHHVIPVTYPGDVGTHVAKCLWYINRFNQNTEACSVNERAEWLGVMYSKANAFISDCNNELEMDDIKKELALILKQIESKTGEYYEKWLITRQWSIDLMRSVYKWAEIDFERWFFESEVDSDSMEYALELYKNGALINSDGAIGMDLSSYGLGFCMLIKSDGTGLYATKDIELAKIKFDNYGVDESIYVVDNRQTYHFSQVFKVLELIGFKQAEKCYHLQYEMVELPDGAMSSRKGNIIPIMHLIDEMERCVTDKFLSKYIGDWSNEEISSCARIIACGAIKYGMTRVDNNRKIVFDLNDWLRLDGDTGPYIQYAIARIKSLTKKYNFNQSNKDLDPSCLNNSIELDLMVKISAFNDVVYACNNDNKTVYLTSYLFELGKMFNRFYQDVPIGSETDINTRACRLALAAAVGNVMIRGLALLGIKSPDRM